MLLWAWFTGDRLTNAFFAVGGVLIEAVKRRTNMYVAVGTYDQHPQNGLVPFSMEAAARSVTPF